MGSRAMGFVMGHPEEEPDSTTVPPMHQNPAFLLEAARLEPLELRVDVATTWPGSAARPMPPANRSSGLFESQRPRGRPAQSGGATAGASRADRMCSGVWGGPRGLHPAPRSRRDSDRPQL